MHSALLVPLLFLWVTGELSTLRQLIVPLLTRFHGPPCSRTTCLVDIAWLGQSAMPVAEVHIPCMGTYMVTLAILLALLG